MALYTHLAELLTYPTSELLEAHVSGTLRDDLEQLRDSVPYALPLDVEGLQADREDGIASDYIRIFDVPTAGSTCPLYGGVLTGDRSQVMEDLLRLYRHFGLSTVNAEVSDLPDAIPAVLEFLAFLTYQECEASAGEVETFRRAQRDLLERYVTNWASLVKARVAALDPPPIYRSTTSLFDTFVATELAVLARDGAR